MTTPDIERIRERWGGSVHPGLNAWEGQRAVQTLLAAVDERDKRITELEARIADLEHESDAGWAQAKSDNARIEAVRHELEMRYGDGTVEAQFIREALDGDL